MTDLQHLIAGDHITEEHYRIWEAYMREHDLPVAGARINAAQLNAAIDWWNQLRPEGEQEDGT